MEFMATGVPVVASRTRIDEYYFNSDLVEFFESDDAGDLARKLLGLIEHPERVAELKQNTAEFIASNNWDVKKQEYFAVVDRLTAKARQPRADQERNQVKP